MAYRVLIPTAGTGSRLGELTRYINKSLVGLDNRPVICHIIEQFPDDAEFVIALGHKGDLVRDFLQMAYPDRTFFFCPVDPWEGPGSGLGLSVLSCMKHLEQPFIFTSCDTLVKEHIPVPDRNWLGWAERSDISQYRTLLIEDGFVKSICEKNDSGDGAKPYIGLAGIYNYTEFWRAMKSGGADAVSMGESYGLRAILGMGAQARSFTWYDTGNMTELAMTREAYSSPDAPNILEKANEAIWFVGGAVIKFSDDVKFIKNRVKRAELLSGFVPEITGERRNLYSYRKVEGRVLSDVISIPLFEKLLSQCGKFWHLVSLTGDERSDFQEKCMKFYRDKTLERVDLFYKNFDKKDEAKALNGVRTPPLGELLDRTDWVWLADGLPGRFHGDFHFENIIYTPESDKFTFIDWRQEFGSSLSVGDIYYDLAKLLHGLIINHELIALDRYSVDWRDDGSGEINFDFGRKQILVECERYFCKWLEQNGYDVKKVITLTGLVYLNIAALHHYPYSLLLYALGSKMLFESLAER